ncbi:MAG: hypothetical protein J4432_00790 [DPANN group archaeon]|nr:hypothetical protein [DPANN group archaeon]
MWKINLTDLDRDALREFENTCGGLRARLVVRPYIQHAANAMITIMQDDSIIAEKPDAGAMAGITRIHYGPHEFRRDNKFIETKDGFVVGRIV